MQTASKLERVYLGMSWKEKGSSKIDVDASLVAFSGGELQDVIHFGKLINDSKSCRHTGDVLTGGIEAGQVDKNSDLERVYIWLTKMPANIDCVVCVANVYTSGVSFADISNAYIRLVNADTDQELARVPLSGGGLKGNALVFAKLYRTTAGKGSMSSGEGAPVPWQLLSLGMATTVQGMTSVSQMVPMLQSTGCAYPPVAAAAAGSLQPQAAGGKPEKIQKPRSVLPCAALAVAGDAGIAAATAIFLEPDLTRDMMNSETFTSCTDFSANALEVISEPLAG